MHLEGQLLRGRANTPHLNPLPYTTTGLLREYDVQRLASLGSVRLGSPQGERRSPEKVRGRTRETLKHAKLRNEPDWKLMVFMWNSQIVRELGRESGKIQSGSFGTELGVGRTIPVVRKPLLGSWQFPVLRIRELCCETLRFAQSDRRGWAFLPHWHLAGDVVSSRFL
jgi:hypothetical protein